MRHIVITLLLLLGVGSRVFAAAGPPSDSDLAELMKAMDGIEPWRNTTTYSAQGWEHLIAVARKLQVLPEERVVDLLRDYQKRWIPAQRWERMLIPYRRGELQGSPIPVTRLAVAYREYATRQMAGELAQPKDGAQPIGPGIEPSQRAGGVFLLLRVLFEIPETPDDHGHEPGEYQFVTAPRFYGQSGDKNWPLSWKDGHPQLTAPLLLYFGTPYNAAEEYRSFLDKYPLRRWDGSKPSSKAPLPLQKQPDVIALMKSAGFVDFNSGFDNITPSFNTGSNQLGATIALLDKGTDANARDIADWTALMYAAATDRPETASLLLERGADVNAANLTGRTPCMFAATQRSSNVLAILLARKPAIDARDEEGHTALMYAAGATRGRTEWIRFGGTPNAAMVRLLLANGADPDLQDELGMTALMHALDRRDREPPPEAAEVVAELVARGADVNLRDIWGQSALTMAKKLKNKAAFQLLQLKGAKE